MSERVHEQIEEQVLDHSGRKPADIGWSVFSYMIGGMAVYGLIGWLVARWTHVAVLFPVGMLAGLAGAIALIIFRFSKLNRQDQQNPQDQRK
jgi:ATP synthase protein I